MPEQPPGIDPFQAEWLRFHPNTHPIGHLLDQSAGWNMTRFHLLPGNAGRVATRAQLADLMRRFATLAAQVLAEGEQAWLITLSTPNADHKARARHGRLYRRFGLYPGWQFFSASDKLSYTVWAGVIDWHPRELVRLFLQIYHGDIWDVVFMNRHTGAVFRPYDCGAFVSRPTPQELMATIQACYGWLPQDGKGFLNFNPAQMKGVKFQVSKPCAEAINRAVKKA